MKSLIVLPRAEVDIFDAAIWYETEREGLGRAFEADFDRIASRIQAAPLHFPEIEPDVRRAMLGRFPYGVFFVVGEEIVTVFAVLHLHRDPETWRGRK
jgi:plasmid stabilization system protein ParE